MKALIEQLPHIARRSESQMEWGKVDVLELLEQTVTVLNTSYDREFKLITTEQSLLVVADIAKFKQLLYILLDNARKYSSDKIEVVARKNGNTVIQISDTGIGIPKEALPLVFERFCQVDKARSRETGGFGLGLSLAKNTLNGELQEVEFVQTDDGGYYLVGIENNQTEQEATIQIHAIRGDTMTVEWDDCL